MPSLNLFAYSKNRPLWIKEIEKLIGVFLSQNYFLIFLKQHRLSRDTYQMCRLQATGINWIGLIFIPVDVEALLPAQVESKFPQWIAAKVSFPQRG